MKKTNSLIIIAITLMILAVQACKQPKKEVFLIVNKDSIEINHWKFDPKAKINLYVFDEKTQKRITPEVLGNVKQKDNRVYFKPLYPLNKNTEYLFSISDEAFLFEENIRLSKGENVAKPQVEKIYPSSSILPENLLRMYIYFSQPMKTQGTIEHVKIYNDKREEVKNAIFNNVQELWDYDQKRLTVIFDPSRVKTALKAHEELGRAIQRGKTYKLVVEKAESVNGIVLEKPFEKTFEVIEEDFTKPNTNNWKIEEPQSETKEPLKIIFPNQLDYGSLTTRIQIGKKNKLIKGKIEVLHNETKWKFIPIENWKKGSYILYINSRLADPSGNNLNGLFDHKLGDLISEKEGEIIEIEFEIN